MSRNNKENENVNENVNKDGETWYRMTDEWRDATVRMNAKGV